MEQALLYKKDNWSASGNWGN